MRSARGGGGGGGGGGIKLLCDLGMLFTNDIIRISSSEFLAFSFFYKRDNLFDSSLAIELSFIL